MSANLPHSHLSGHTPDLAIARLAGRQHGLAKSAHLLAAGLDSDAIAKRVRSGRLHPKYRGVYTVGHEALSREGEWLAAVYWAGEGAALSHLSAAELWALWRRRVLLIDVLAPKRRQCPMGIRLHRARHLDPRDVTTHKGIPVTTVARTLVDLSDVLTAHELANVIHEAAFRGRFSEPATRDAITRANGRHNLATLEQALALNAAGSAGLKSGNESAFLSLLQFTNLPEPLVNTHLHGKEVDFHWPHLKLAVEVDGRGHTRPRTRRDDAARDAKLRAAGYTVLRFTDEDVHERPDFVAATLSAARSARLGA